MPVSQGGLLSAELYCGKLQQHGREVKLMHFYRGLVFFIIGTIPILFAAVQPWIWAFYCICMMAAFLISLWLNHSRVSGIFGGFSCAVLLFFLYTLFLCLPLPPDILSRLSPVRYQILARAPGFWDSASTWQTLSYNPQAGLSWWIFLLSLWLLFITVRMLCVYPKVLKTMVRIMIGIAIVEAVYGLFQALVPSLGVLWTDVQAYMGDARGTFINRNNFAGFMEMVWPLALGFTIAQGGWQEDSSFKKILASEYFSRQAFLALGIVVLLLSVFCSHSRAGIAGASLGFLTFLSLIHINRKGLSRGTWLTLLGIVTLLTVYSMIIGVGPIAERFLTLSEGDSRLDFWRDSLLIVRDHPFGIGLRNYEKVFPVYNVSLLSDNQLLYAHNDYLQLLIEAGWIAFLAVVSGFAIFMWKSARRIRRLNFRKNPLRFFLAAGAYSGLISMAFHSFFDFNLQIPANCVYFVVLLAIVYSCAWSVDYAE